MVFKASLGLYDFLGIFRRRFVEILIAVAFIAFLEWRRLYHLAEGFNLTFWIYQAITFAFLIALALVYFRPDLILFNSTVTQFTIEGEHLTITTAGVNIPLLVNKPSFRLKLKMHQFARSKVNFPTRVFSKTKYLTWELRTDEQTVYVIARFFTPEAWDELEKFLYWKNIEPLSI